MAWEIPNLPEVACRANRPSGGFLEPWYLRCCTIELICDLDDAADQPRIQALEKQQSDLLNEDVKNENEVNEKIKELLTTQPMSQLDKEKL